MLKIASMSLDIVDHVLNEDIDKIAELAINLSDEAKQAHIPTFEEEQNRDSSDFALVITHPTVGELNKYGRYSPSLVELNLAFLSKDADSLPDEIVKIAATNLVRAANEFKIKVPENLQEFKSADYVNNKVDLQKINELAYFDKISRQEKTANRFAWKQEKKYPLDTDIQIIKAASYFDLHHNEMTISKKLEFVLNVKQAARENKVGLEKTAIDKYAYFDKEAFNEDFETHVRVRQSYLKPTEGDLHRAFSELITRAPEIGALKTAQVLNELDKKAYFEYGHGIEDPLYSTLKWEKSASIDVDGISVTKQQIDSLSDDDLTAIVGNDVIPDLKGEEGLEVLASLPKPIRAEILNLIE